MEVWLNKRQKIKKLFAKLGIKSDLTLKSLFKPSISKKVLLHYLDELESKRPALLDFKAIDDKELLMALIIHNPDLSAKKIMQIYGLAKALEIINMRELRSYFAKNKQQLVQKMVIEAKEVKLISFSGPLDVIRKHLNEFISFKNFY